MCARVCVCVWMHACVRVHAHVCVCVCVCVCVLSCVFDVPGQCQKFTCTGIKKHDDEGRLIVAEYDNHYIIVCCKENPTLCFHNITYIVVQQQMYLMQGRAEEIEVSAGLGC